MNLTLTEALLLDAGPQLDAVVAEMVMGQVRVGDCPMDMDCCPGKYAPKIGPRACLSPYSTDMAAAWLVVEKMIAKGWDPMLSIVTSTPARDEWMVQFDGDTARQFGPICLAICRAAIEACWEDVVDLGRGYVAVFDAQKKAYAVRKKTP